MRNLEEWYADGVAREVAGHRGGKAKMACINRINEVIGYQKYSLVQHWDADYEHWVYEVLVREENKNE